MKQYIVKLMFNIKIDEGNSNSQFDEQIRLIEANSSENAFQKAISIGREEESSFVNNNNKIVAWKFIDVTEIIPLHNYKDGEQLYSVTHEEKHTHSYINFIREQAMLVRLKNLTFA